MTGMKRGVGGWLVLALALQFGTAEAQSGCSTTNDPATRTKVGSRMPEFTVQNAAGGTFSLAAQRGKVVVVNFWATWCGPCQMEIPRLEREVWQKYKGSPRFAMIAIAREQTAAEITPFQVKSQFTFPIASDPKRSTYSLFAESGIPRTYVVDGSGKILFQSVGYCPDVVDLLERTLAKALGR